jgi:hypothetical protein
MSARDILSGTVSLADAIDTAVEESYCDPYEPQGRARSRAARDARHRSRCRSMGRSRAPSFVTVRDIDRSRATSIAFSFAFAPREISSGVRRFSPRIDLA